MLAAGDGIEARPATMFPDASPKLNRRTPVGTISKIKSLFGRPKVLDVIRYCWDGVNVVNDAVSATVNAVKENVPVGLVDNPLVDDPLQPTLSPPSPATMAAVP